MSIFSDLDSMVLRSVSNPPLTTKGSDLTYAELDNHAVKIYDAVQSIVSGENVTAYDAGTVYDMFDTDIRKRFASYNSRIWKAAYVGSPSTFSGQTPEEGIYWEQVTLAQLMPNIMSLASFANSLSNDNNSCPTYCAKLEIASADVLQLNSTPLTIVPAQGAGTVIEVLSAISKMTYNSIPYATNTDMILNTSTSTEKQAEVSISESVDMFSRFTLETNSETGIVFVDNQSVVVSVGGGNPTAGNSDITVYVMYRIINL